MANIRNAGRKNRFDNKDVEKMITMIKNGYHIDEVANKLNTSRQVVGRYINKKPEKNFFSKSY